MNYKTLTTYLAGGMFFASSLFAAEREEWYDPSDWFDDEPGDGQVQYEEDRDDYNYGYSQQNNAGDYYGQQDRQSNQRYSDQQNQRNQGADAYAVYTIYSVDTNANGQNTWEKSEQNASQNNRFSQDSRFSQNQSQFSAQSGQFSGTIKAMKTVKLSSGSQSKAHTLATVKLDQGPTLMMTLGEKQNIKDLDLREGDQVTIEGSAGDVGGTLVFVADKIRSSGKSAQLDNALAQIAGKRSGQSSELFSQSSQYGQNSDQRNQYGQSNRSNQWNQSSDQRNQYGQRSNQQRDEYGQSSNRNQQDRQYVRGYGFSGNSSQNSSWNSSNSEDMDSVQGKVESFRRISLQGEDERHQLLKVRLRDNSTELVNLGPETTLNELDLMKGDSITIKGQTNYIDGKEVIFAEKIKVDGQRVGM